MTTQANSPTALLAALVCRDRLAFHGYQVQDLGELCVGKEIPGLGYVLLSGYDPTDRDSEPFVPVDLDAPAFFTLWDEAGQINECGEPSEIMFEHATLRAALDEIEGLCHRGNPNRAIAGEIGDDR